MKAGEIIASRYRLKSKLGVGGMGEVWSAVHTATDREFAIKFMHAHSAQSESARNRFSKEARASARINHPNIIDVFDVGSIDDGSLYMVMELLDGLPLADAFYGVPPLSVRDFVAVMLDTARALSAAHGAGIVHRDVKPQNIFLHRERGSGLAYAKVLDFGISKFSTAEDASQTKTSSILGSPRYMSPEQTRSAANTDHRADIWALGVVLFEGLTGRWPHDGDSFSSLVVAIATEPPHSIDALAPHLPEGLRAIVRGCLLPLDRRFQSLDDVVRGLERVIEDGDLAALPLPRPHGAGGEATRLTVTTGNLRVRTPPPLTGSGSAQLSRSGTDFSRSGPDFSRSGPDFSRSGADFSRSGADFGRSGAGLAHASGQYAAAAPAASYIPGPTGATMPLPPGSRGGPPLPPASHPGYGPQPASPTSSGVALPPYTLTAPIAPFTTTPSGPRPDGLTTSVSSLNVETVAMQSGAPLPARPEVSAAYAPYAPASPPRAATSAGTRLGILAAVLGVATLGIGVLVVAAARSPRPASPPAPAATEPAAVEAAASATPPTPAATTEAQADPPAAPSATATATASAAPQASTAPASTPRAAGGRPPAPKPPARPPPTGKGTKIKDLGSGL